MRVEASLLLNNTLLLLIAVVLLLVLALVVGLYFRSRNKQLSSAQMGQQRVEDILQEALDSRSVFNVRFEVEDVKDRFMRGPCVAVGSNKLLIDVNINYAVPTWVGLPVRVYFSSNKGTLLYEFSTSIARTVPYLGNVALELYFPNTIVPNQRRAFVRFTPPNRFVGNIRLWKGRIVQHVEGLQPHAVPAHTLDGDALTIDNISAGGIRLAFTRMQYDSALLDTDQLVLLCLTLRNGDGLEILTLWLVSTVMQCIEEKRRIMVSLKFERWAPEGDGDSPLSWFPVGREGGVAPLAAWVMRRQLEIQCKSL